MEDRDVNLVELALATNIPKGCAETVVRGKTQLLGSRSNLSRETDGAVLLSSFSSERVVPGWERQPGKSGHRLVSALRFPWKTWKMIGSTLQSGKTSKTFGWSGSVSSGNKRSLFVYFRVGWGDGGGGVVCHDP